MKYKVYKWLMDNRVAIGYTLGGLNVLSGLADIAFGNYGLGLLWIVLGSLLIYDARVIK